MQNIVHLTTVHPRFDTRIFINEAQTLASRYGNSFYLVVADGLGNETVDNVQIVDLGKLNAGRIMRTLVGSWRAFRQIRKLDAKLVHFHDPELMLLGISLSLLRYKVVYDVHEDISETIKTRQWIPSLLRRPASKLVRVTERIASMFYDAIVTVTPKISAKFPMAKTHMVQNYPRFSELLFDDAKPYLQRENSIAYVGVLTSRRAAIEMVEAAALVPESYALIMTLSGAFRPDSLKEKLSVKPGWGKIKFLGWGGRAQIAEQLASARAGIVLSQPDPNHMDAKPVKLYEYMSVGLPVIAADFPAWREQVGHIDCAIFVNPLDPRAIADAIVWILDNPVLAMQMGENGQQAVREQYNWDLESTKLISLYENLTNDFVTSIN